MSSKKPTALKGGVHKLHVIKGDRVKVIAGKDKGLVGEVIAVYPERQKVTVAGVNIAKRHLKDTSAQPQGRSTTKGGIVSSEAPIHVSNVQLVVKNDSGDEFDWKLAGGIALTALLVILGAVRERARLHHLLPKAQPQPQSG